MNIGSLSGQKLSFEKKSTKKKNKKNKTDDSIWYYKIVIQSNIFYQFYI